MDRLNLTLAGCGLALLLAAPGCKGVRPEVPPGPAYSPDGKQVPPSVGFSSEAHPSTSPIVAGGLHMTPPGGPTAASTTGQLGTPAPGAANMGAPSDHAYGAPDYLAPLSPSLSPAPTSTPEPASAANTGATTTSAPSSVR